MGFWSGNKNKIPGRLIVTQTIPGTNKTKVYEGLLGGRDPIHELFADEFSSGFETAPDSTWGWEDNTNKAKVEVDLTPNIENLRLTPSPVNLKNLSQSNTRSNSPLSQTKKEGSRNNSNRSSLSKSPPAATTSTAVMSEMESRLNKFDKLLKEENVAIDALRKLSWKGIPTKYRAESWKLLLGYASSNSGRRQESLLRKRNEYFNVSKQLFDNGEDSLDKTIFQQISIDLPRTFPTTTLFHQPSIRKIMERVLYTWSIRHPASGYVQGINDIVCPFIIVFLIPYLPENQDPEAFDVSSLSEEVLNIIEADTFWCFSKLMDGIQDNYTFAQRGIQRQLTNLKALIERADNELATHLMNENVEFIQFAFRWMNCLLLREVNLNCSIRMWDTYLSEGFDNFSDFHLYVCAAFLQKFKADLLTKDFQDILLYLQSPPTKSWTNSDIELLLSEAYLLQSLFKNAPNLFS